MAKFIILCLAGFVVCDAGLIENKNFPNFNAIYHGHGATSYQNFQIDNYGSVPIPKDLQVDDGHEYHHSQYLHDDVDLNHEIPSKGLENYEQPVSNDFIVAIEDSHVFGDNIENEDHVELESQHNYTPNNYEHSDQEAEYEYH